MEHEIKTSPILRIVNLVRSESKNIRYLYAYAIIAGAISLVLPLGIQSMMGLVIGGRLSSGWLILVIVITGGVFLAGITRLAQISILENIQQRMFMYNAFEFSSKISGLASRLRNRTGILQASEKFLDIITLQKSFTKLVLDFTASVLQILFGLLLLVIYHPAFMLFGGILVFTLVLVIRFTWKSGLSTARKESDYKFKTAYWILEIARNRSLFSMPGNNNFHMHRTDELLTGYLKGRKDHFRIIVRQAVIAIIMKVVLTATLLFLGSWLLIQQSISIGQFLASEILIITLLSAVEKLVLTVENIFDSGIALEKLGAVTDMEMPLSSINPELVKKGIPQITLTYHAEKQHTLVLPTGSKTGICSIPGSGRTGLIHAILGEKHPVWSATINSMPSTTLFHDNFQLRAGICFQNSSLFEGSIIDNIALGKEIDLEKLSYISEIVGLKTFIQGLEHSFSHEIDANSTGIPNNIVRKIMLSRALYNAEEVLLIDDIWAVFNRNEIDSIMKYIQNIDATTVVISNHFPVLNHMNKTVFVSDLHFQEYSEISKDIIPEELKPIIWI